MFSKPISMHVFIWAKFFALVVAVTVIFLFQALLVWKQFYVYELSNQSLLMALYWLLCVYFQGMIILAISMAFTVLTGSIMGLVLNFIMLLLPYLWGVTSLVWVCWSLPALPWFDISNALYKGDVVPWHYMVGLAFYACLYSLVWLNLSMKWMQRKEF